VVHGDSNRYRICGRGGYVGMGQVPCEGVGEGDAGAAMSEDRELLELAAKAAGYIARSDGEGGVCIVVAPGRVKEWNPLFSDSDAFRLFVKLRMDVDIEYGEVATGQEFDRHQTLIDDTGDPYAATRRAIVRAAAEIGRA
jgi:hypothetical protein